AVTAGSARGCARLRLNDHLVNKYRCVRRHLSSRTGVGFAWSCAWLGARPLAWPHALAGASDCALQSMRTHGRGGARGSVVRPKLPRQRWSAEATMRTVYFKLFVTARCFLGY